MKDRNFEIICISGSTRFLSLMYEVAEILSLENAIVVMPFVNTRDEKFSGLDINFNMLVGLHAQKIVLCSELFVVNPDNYIGESTSSEINFAKWSKKKVNYYHGSYIEKIIEERRK
jgi:hypothetical protein